MKPKPRMEAQQSNFLMPDLSSMLDAKQPLYVLAGKVDWAGLERDFERYYHALGRPALPIRRMVGLLMLKQLFNLSDERVVEQWRQNPYFQFFCGETQFQWGAPCEASELVHFRHRIGPPGGERVLAETVRLHGPPQNEAELVVDTTAQPKNIAFPTDSGLYAKVIAQCSRIARQKRARLAVDLQAVRQLRMVQGRRRSVEGRRKARQATRRLKRLARAALRQVRPLVGRDSKWSEVLERCARVLKQKRHDQAKIYSLHEPQVCCLAREKTRTKYEFGSKAAIAVTKKGVILAAVSFDYSIHDNHTVEPMLAQIDRIASYRPDLLVGDRGFRGQSQFGSTRVVLPQVGATPLSEHLRARGRTRYRRRAAIEPRIGHLKSDFGLGRNFLKGTPGDALNLLLAASASNLRLWCNAFLAALLNFALLFWRELASAFPPRPGFRPITS
jgi:transposase, IS5 family